MFRVLIIVFLININFIFSQDKGLEYYQNQEFEAAKNYYESIILEYENPEAQLGKGSSSFQLGDYDSAKGAFEESLRSNDNIIRSKALYNLGNTLYQNQKNEEALAYYRKALELNPDDKEARYNYELLKYQPDPPEDDQKDQDKKEEKEQEQDQNKEQEQQQEQDQNKEQKQQQEQEQQQEQASEEEKSQDMKQAESILDALKQDEQVMQKKQIARSKSRKLAKDW